MIYLLSLALLASNWNCEKTPIASRLVYDGSPLKIEFLQLEQGLTAFVFLEGQKFNEKNVKLTFSVDGEKFDEVVAVRLGQMKAKLSLEITDRLMLALQDQKKIGILANGFEEEVSSTAFEKAFHKFIQGSEGILSSIKGPIE